MSQKWYKKTGVQTALVTGLFLLLSTIIAGIFGVFQKKDNFTFNGKSRPLDERMLQSLPFNIRVNFDEQSYFQKNKKGTEYLVRERDYADGIFRLKPIKSSYNQNDEVIVFLIFSENFDISKVDVLFLSLEKEIRKYNYILYKKLYYEVKSINKLAIILDVPKGDYTFIIGCIKKEGGDDLKYIQMIRNISIY